MSASQKESSKVLGSLPEYIPDGIDQIKWRLKHSQFSEHGSLKLLVSLLLSIQVTEKESAIVKGGES